MIALDSEFAPMGRAAFAEAGRVVFRHLLDSVWELDDGELWHWGDVSKWRHHGLGVLQRELTPTLRVHVWAPELFQLEGDPLRPVHDHRFDLVSFVAAGEIVDESYWVERLEPEFEVDGRDEESYSRVWNVKHAKVQDGVSDVELLGPVHVIKTERRIISAGEVYGIERGQFHTTRIEKPIAVTLVSRSRFGEEPARILGRETVWGGIVHDERDEDLYREVLSRAESAIRAELEEAMQ